MYSARTSAISRANGKTSAPAPANRDCSGQCRAVDCGMGHPVIIPGKQVRTTALGKNRVLTLIQLLVKGMRVYKLNQRWLFALNAV